MELEKEKLRQHFHDLNVIYQYMQEDDYVETKK
jgi:hypothetical protein